MSAYLWTCSFCSRPTTITEQNYRSGAVILDLNNKDGLRKAILTFIVCPNPKCKKFSLNASLCETYRAGRAISRYWEAGKMLNEWHLIPPSDAKVFPKYIPKQILADYKEACLVKNFSPKASATLSRRCLQGMIRDFWGVQGGSLKEEIDAIQNKVDPVTWKAIGAVRNIGNIGAHMEEDVNLIIDVVPTEAKQLIGLIEILLKDWYVNRHERAENLRKVVKTAKIKKAKKQPKPEA